MSRWLLPTAAIVLAAAVLLASWTSPRGLPRLTPLFVNRESPASNRLDVSRSVEQWSEHSIRSVLTSIGKRFRWRWSGSGPAELPAPGDKYADALRVIAAWSEQHEADDCVAIVRDARHGGEICLVSQ